MCGLIVIVERNGAVDERRLRRATDRMRHRGPDATGVALSSQAVADAPGSRSCSIGMSHARLAIIDLGEGSDQPLRRGTRTLVYNGEIYNFRELRDELEDSGSVFSTEGDGEVLAELVSRRGVDALADANGMWAFCLLDEAAGTLVAARDRYGKKPLFYAFDERRLCMASTIDAILTYLGRRATPTQGKLESYLVHGALFPEASTDTYLDGISQVGAGCALELDLDSWRLTARRVIDLAAEVRSGEPCPEALPARLEDAVRCRLVSDRKVGLLLSGGVDSSLILSVLAKTGHLEQVQCYTGEAGKSEDGTWARRSMAALGIEATTIDIDYGGESFEAFLSVCRHQEKPFPFLGIALSLPQMYQAIAANGAAVVLDGTGGDEIFGGYWNRHYRFALADALAKGDSAWLAQTIAANRDDAHLSAICEACLSGPDGHHRAAEIDRTDGRSGIADALERFMGTSGREIPSTDPLTSFRGSFDDALLLDATAGRLQEWLWLTDRNAMAFGIENRSPLLDHRLAPYLRTGYARKLVGPWNKRELRDLFQHFRPLPVQWRREKQGFRWAFRRFLTRNREKVVELIAASRCLRGLLRHQKLIDHLARDDELLFHELTLRTLCIAGIEAAIGLAAPEPARLDGR